MIIKLIEKYISNLTLEDVYTYSSNKGIGLTSTEANYIYNAIKKDYKLVFDGNVDTVLESLKSNVSTEVYNEIVSLYNHYKSVYKF